MSGPVGSSQWMYNAGGEATYWGERGINAGDSGGSRSNNTIDYITIASTGNSSDFGDLSNGRGGNCAMSNGSRGVIGTGYEGSGAGGTNETISYITFATTGNDTDFGDTGFGQNSSVGGSNGTRGLMWANGYSCTTRDVILYITMDTTGNATDFGDASSAEVSRGGCVNSETRCVQNCSWHCFAGNDTLEYVTFDTLGNAVDFGNALYSNPTSGDGVSDGVRGVWGGTQYGSSSNWANMGGMEYITIASTGNTTGFGNHTAGNSDPHGHNGARESGACNNDTRGCFMGGHPYYSIRNNIDYITIQSTGDASDFGDISSGTSNSSGGTSGD